MNCLCILLLSLQSVFSLKAIVIGGGPSGKLSAIALAQKGVYVSLYEKKDTTKEDNKSFNFIISKRGLNILQKYNIDLNDAVFVKNIVSHLNNNKKPIVSKSPQSISIDRTDLLKAMDEKLDSLGVLTEISEFEDADFENRIAYLSHGSERYDLLVGADGSNSQVRTKLACVYKDVVVSETMDDRSYKRIKLDPLGFSYLPGSEHSWNESFHIWKSEHCDLICPPTKDQGLKGVFVSSNNEFNYKDFKSFFSLMKPKDIIEFELESPKFQRTITSSCIGIESVVLVGDSGHTMLASLGQGVICGLESAMVLSNCLDFFKSDEICYHYNRLRLDDAHAICELSRMRFGGTTKLMRYINNPNLSYSDILKLIKKYN